MPYVFPHPGLMAGEPRRPASSIAARAGQFAYDTMTLIGPGTWEAARAAADAALTATDLVLAGESAAYACCRPPGHHVTRTAIGGSCYLNNSALAAARLRDALQGPVAVIDVDAHHGNGTQAIFYEDRRVLTGSVHVDPDTGWFPHFLGAASETGRGDGDGANRNLPLAPGSGDGPWLEAAFRPGRLGPRWGRPRPGGGARRRRRRGRSREPPAGHRPGIRRAGRELGGLGLPTVIVQEGGTT